MSTRRPSKGRRPPVRPGRRPRLPEVKLIRRQPSPPGSRRRIGKGSQRMIFGNKIIKIEGIRIRKFNWKEKKVEED